MSAFAPIPLGQPIPAGPHSVSCSLPTLRSVRGYEEKDPAITRHLTSGYPRFVVHPFSLRLAAEFGTAGRALWLTSSERMAGELARHLGPASGAVPFARDGLHGVSHPESAATAAQAKLYLQHIGGFLSSREAEDRLVSLGLAAAPPPETVFPGDAAAEVRRWLRGALPGAGEDDLLLANSGMNAVYAAFRAVSEIQAARGRTGWVQLGWLYLDTIAILRKFTPRPDDYVPILNPLDKGALERLFAEQGSRLAGVFAEIPTNPLIQTPDLPWLAALCRRHGVRLVVDPSVASVGNVLALPHADIVVDSLTKYTGSEGDVIAGAVAINPAGPDAAGLRRRAAAWLEPVYPRDLARLAAQIGETDAVLARIHASTPRVAAFLQGHPRVKEVFWALRPTSRDHYLAVARTPDAVGGMISFSLRDPLEPFYDRLRLPKGPSFGMKTTLICPFLYLAHYDLVTSAAGRAGLEANGLDPDLLRLCVGVEPVEDILAALAEALG
jgi:cystathionine gamma-synthase